MMMLGELRGVSAFVTHNLGLHCALPSIVALRASGRVLRRVILSEMKAVRRADSIHKTGCSSTFRRTQKHCAVASLEVERTILIVFRRTKIVLM